MTHGGVTAREAVEAVARRSHGNLIARLAALTRDVAGAEDALSSAFAAALVDWQAGGVPRSPEAWLVAVARRKWIDSARRRRSAEDAAGHLRLIAEEIEAAAADADEQPEDPALMFACGHPAIEAGLRAPLLLQTVLGFDAAAIASAFLVPPAAMSQRLVRAKKKLRKAGLAFQPPGRAELAARVEAVRDAIRIALARRAGHAVRRTAPRSPNRRIAVGRSAMPSTAARAPGSKSGYQTS